eukprot:CAMPEP_0198275398 /NCGR_PEP_ID=MMETSP1447-20131203/64402_1 /TAXON_ID=420782 /ORGANISM="Chaetoceros dichaeta, Strain CCMP1751" /LENGTH=160 /DNA_ID=CAMNT_0043970219 /DNA_START=44 /DNA_END=526 /DNA_ORIENTATION=+
MSASIPNSIPNIIILEGDVMMSAGSSEDSVMIHCSGEIPGIGNSLTAYEYDTGTESEFCGGIISLSSDGHSLEEIPEILPLDYRIGWTIDTNTNENLKDCITRNESICMCDIECMDVDALYNRPNDWEMESICGDSLDTEEDVSSILEWISSGNEHIWNC